MKSKLLLTMFLLLTVSFLVSGCSLLGGGEDTPDEPDTEETPTKEPTKRPTIEEEDDDEITVTPTEKPSPSTSPSVTPSGSPTPPSESDSDRGKINVSAVEITSATGELFNIHVEGAYTDTCTRPNYSWNVEGSVVMINLGIEMEDTECNSSSNSYSGDIEINYSFKDGKDYVADVNGVVSESVTFSE